MGLPPLSGSASLESQPSDKTPVTQTDAYEEVPVVKNVAVNNSAFIAEDYPKTSVLLSAYAEGSAIQCTYYHVYSSTGLSRSSITDLTALRDNIDIALLKIAQFEMKVPQAFSLSWDGASSEATVEGEAVSYPGFNPLIGDHFIYMLTSGQVGVFRVEAVEPLSYHSERLHRVSFRMVAALDADIQTLLNDRVRKTVVFDRQVYLEGNKTLLTEESYSFNQTLKQGRILLANYYYRSFYAKDLASFVSPEGIYDPYVVKFMNAIVSFDDVKKRAKQVYADVDATWDYTLWARLLDNTNLDTADLVGLYSREIKFNTYLDIAVTGLINRGVNLVRPSLDKDQPDTWPEGTSNEYVVSAGFYAADLGTMSAWDQIVYTAITTRKVDDIAGLISTYLNGYRTLWTVDEQFYNIPLLIRVMDLARSSLAPNIR